MGECFHVHAMHDRRQAPASPWRGRTNGAGTIVMGGQRSRMTHVMHDLGRRHAASRACRERAIGIEQNAAKPAFHAGCQNGPANKAS
jgi:hypothetical protein